MSRDSSLPHPKERRQFKRFAVRLPATLYLKSDPSQVYEGVVYNISSGGAFFRSPVPMPLGDEVILQIRVGNAATFEAYVIEKEEGSHNLPKGIPKSAVIRWGSDSDGFGVQFIRLSAESRRFLAELLQRLEDMGAPEA